LLSSLTVGIFLKIVGIKDIIYKYGPVLLNKIISRHRELIYRETEITKDFMRLLMKQGDTGQKWTRD